MSTDEWNVRYRSKTSAEGTLYYQHKPATHEMAVDVYNALLKHVGVEFDEVELVSRPKPAEWSVVRNEVAAK